MASVAAVLGWVGVGAYGIWEMSGEESGDSWERPYTLFTASLAIALAATVLTAWTRTAGSSRSPWRTVGLGLAVITVAASVVAWAIPLWGMLLALTCTVLMAGASRAVRPGLAVVAAAPVVGLATALAGTAAELGEKDSYGDYPAAFGLGTTTIAAGALIGVGMLVQGRSGAPAADIDETRAMLGLHDG
ncbi:MAG: hypothetical protein R2695_19890 [Acidimicrobiales bacterium]